MFPFTLFSSLPAALAMFLISLSIVIWTSTQFTRKLEELCEAFHLSIGMLSLLSALGANIPNYVSSAIAIATGHDDVGIGIIVGSNIYNIAVILGLCTFFTPDKTGIVLEKQEQRDVGIIACYTLIIILLSFGVIFWLPSEPFLTTLHASSFAGILFPLTIATTLATFSALLIHTLRRSHGSAGTTLHHHQHAKTRTLWSLLRLVGEVILTLTIALGGVLVMVQSGQTLTADLHMPPMLAGLLVLAVATSLPNTVVAISLVRTGEKAACVEEVSSSSSMNTVLGVVLPLAFWHSVLADRFLLLLDGPLLVMLSASMFVCVLRGRIGRGLGVLLLWIYVAWVLIRFWL